MKSHFQVMIHDATVTYKGSWHCEWNGNRWTYRDRWPLMQCWNMHLSSSIMPTTEWEYMKYDGRKIDKNRKMNDGLLMPIECQPHFHSSFHSNSIFEQRSYSFEWVIWMRNQITNRNIELDGCWLLVPFCVLLSVRHAYEIRIFI